MATPEFTHLHCHTEYSLLDGLARVGPLMDAAKAHKMTSLALTDHGVMFGALEFYSEAKKRGIKPIIGMEAYVARRSMDQKEGKQDASGYHFILLAENETGYNNLLTLATEAQLRGYYYKPRIDKELLAKHSDGIVALSACLSSEVARHVMHDDIAAAEKAAAGYADIFKDRFYLELQDHGLGEQRTLNRHLAAISKRLDIPLIVTNDVHYIAREHANAQEVLLCIQTGTTMDDPKRMKMDSHEFYLKSAAEMYATFGDEFPDALKNTMAIAERCSIDLEFGRVQLPDMPVPVGKSQQTYLDEVCHARLALRFEQVLPMMTERLEYELAVIKKTGFAAYFLLLEDIIGFARRQGIRVGPGRGSAVGSLVSYCLGITDVDPLAYDLLFERFLNPDRLSMPDIDTDFADDRRDEVIRYITDRFGADCVAQISTFGTMAAKASIKDTGRALGIPYADVDKLAKLIPALPLKITIKDSMEAIPELAAMYKSDPAVKAHLDTAMALESVKRHASTHAAGVVISHDPLVNVTPLTRAGKEGADGQATQYEAAILDKVGLLKMDILGLTTLTLIQRTLGNIEKHRGIVIEPSDIPLEDPGIYTLLSSGETAGIFQLESGAMRKVLRDMKPDRFTDIIAVVALYRPGPMNFIPQYIARKNGTEKITYPHTDLKPILENTYGIIVYQDQVLKIVTELAGMTWGEADKLRKAMGKKLIDDMKQQQAHFEEGFENTTKWVYKQDDNGEPIAVEVEKPAYPLALARDLWPLIETFAGYGFNKCLSAKTHVKLPDGRRIDISAAYREKPEYIMSMWPDGTVRPHKVHKIVKTGSKNLLRLRTKGGRTIVATPEHRLLTTDGYKALEHIELGAELMTVPHEATDNQRSAVSSPPPSLPQAPSLTSTRSYPAYGCASSATNGMWCASTPERDMCEWLLLQGVTFEMHKVLPTGRICDFYFAGIYWEMDGMDRRSEYFADKYEMLPFIVVTPEDFKFVVEHHLALDHAQNGDPVTSIESAGVDQTYDIEMDPDGPLNFIANEVVSHNSHAAAYAQLACQTAYLKAKYPVEYMAACLSIETGSPDRMSVVLSECRRIGISILPPDVSRSDIDFAVDGESVRYALRAIKNVGDGAIKGIVATREQNGPFTSVDDFCTRIDWKALNKRALESLIKAGALDVLGDRAVLLGNVDRICAHGQRTDSLATAGQSSLFHSIADDEALALPPLLLSTVAPVEQKQILAWEKEMLGLYISEHPLTAYIAQGQQLGVMPLAALTPGMKDKKVRVGIQVTSMRPIVTKKGESMLALEVTDLEQSVEAVVFPRTYAKLRDIWQVDAIVLVEATVDVRNDRVQLIVDNAVPFDDHVSEGGAQVEVRVPRTSDDAVDMSMVQDLYLLIHKYQGTDQASIVLVSPDRLDEVELPDRRTRSCPELLAKIVALVGQENLRVSMKSAPVPTVGSSDTSGFLDSDPFTDTEEFEDAM